MAAKETIRKRFLKKVATVVTRWPRLVLAVALLLTTLSIYSASQLEIRNNIEDYLPRGSKVVDLFHRAVTRYGTSDHMILLVEGDGESDLDVRHSMADLIAGHLREARDAEDQPLIHSVDYRIGEDLVAFYQQTFLKNTILYLNPEDRELFKAKLTDRAITEQIQKNRDLLLSPSASLAKELVTRDPYALRTLFLDRLLAKRGNLKIEYHDGYLTSEDLRWLILIVKPTKPAQNVKFARHLVQEVERAAQIARENIQADGEEVPSNVAVRSTGGYHIAVDYDGIIKRDLRFNIITAFVGVMVLFVLSFRRVGGLFYVGIPLLMGLSWTFGLVSVAVGKINLFTGASAAVLLGLGVDFAIHLLNRYLVEMQVDGNEVRSIQVALTEVGDSALVACGTTSFAFYVTLLADFQGLKQLGLIAGTGLIFCFVANFTVLPAFILVSHRIRPNKAEKELTGFGLEHLARFISSHARPIVIGAIVLTVILGLVGTQVQLDEDFRNFRPQGSSAVALQQEMIEKIGSPLIYTMVLARAQNEADLLRLNEEVSQRLDSLIDEKVVASYLSLDAFVPPPARQAQNLAWLDKERRSESGALDMERIEATTRRAMKASGFSLQEALPPAVESMGAILSVSQPLTLSSLMGTALDQRIARFVSREEGDEGFEVVTYVYPSLEGGLDQKEAEAKIEQALQSSDSEIYVISANLLGRELKRLIKKDAVLATSVALVGCLALLYFHFRSIRLVILTGLPLVVALIWAVGAMTSLGIAFNLVSVGMIPVILGIGIDNGIYLANRYRELGHTQVARVYHDTGRAIVMTSLTTIWGFGSLSLAKYKGLVASGALAAIGVGSCLLTAIILLPALVQVGRERWFQGGIGKS